MSGKAQIIAYCTLILLIGSMHSRLHLNLSASAPIGLWTEKPINPATIKRGTLISFCPPDSPIVRRVIELKTLVEGDCLNTNLAPFLKPVAAVSGDIVRLQEGMPARINGSPLLNTISRESFPAWPDGEYKVKPGEVWVFSSYSDRSFDSRYFGPVSVDQIKGEAAPFLVSGDVAAMTGGN